MSLGKLFYTIATFVAAAVYLCGICYVYSLLPDVVDDIALVFLLCIGGLFIHFSKYRGDDK